MSNYHYSLRELHSIFSQSPENPQGIRTKYATFKHNMIRTLVKNRNLATDGSDDGLSNGQVTRSMIDHCISLCLSHGGARNIKLSPSQIAQKCYIGNDQTVPAVIAAPVKTENRISSRLIAKTLDRNHKDILRAIRNFESSPEFSRRNIAPTTFTDSQGKTQPEYLMSEDAFYWLVTELRGCGELKEQVIEDYRDARDSRDKVSGRNTSGMSFDAIRALVDKAEEHERRITIVETDTKKIEIKVDKIDQAIQNPNGSTGRAPTECIKQADFKKVPEFNGFSSSVIAAALNLYDYPQKKYKALWEDDRTHETLSAEKTAYIKNGIVTVVGRLLDDSTYIKTTPTRHEFNHDILGNYHVRLNSNMAVERLVKSLTKTTKPDSNNASRLF